ncbi:caspase family protein [Terrabacter sp. RAF57]|uniref:caspase family protein n=1 Tax=Terrabacter sp. RAF57 TaxID=3233063 RepID=UPI003F9B7CB6
MERAVVLVGVSRTGGGLPVLQAVDAGVNLMAGWARGQGIPDELVIRITDTVGPVHVKAISSAVRDLVDLASLEQLIVYFSGHGVNVGYNEYWLLSDAPDDASEAVNVRGSADLAEYCGIPHVVLISDACRTPAAGIVGQAVTGTPIFPNRGGGSDEAAVDRFYACTLGRPALEVGVGGPQTPVTYMAVYTQTLVDALQGSAPDVLQPGEDPGQGRVWPAPLKTYLKTAVPARLRELRVPWTTWQIPETRVSADGTWLSQLALASLPPAARSVDVADLPMPVDVYSEQVLDAVLTPGRSRPPSVSDVLENDRAVDPAVAVFERDVLRGEQPPVRDHFETACGFTVEGRRVVDAWAPRNATELLPGGQFVRVHQERGGACNVLLEFDNGSVAMLPAIGEFIGGLLFDEDELVDVSYEPALYTSLRPAYEDRLRDLRRLRSVIAAATRQGVFHLEDEESAGALARQMQVQKSLDPSLALYATYAYHDLSRRRPRLDEMRRVLSRELGVVWYDLAMLTSGRGSSLDDEPNAAILTSPMYPALSQGWALARARQAGDQELLARLSPHLMSSPWSIFAATARQHLRSAMTDLEDR